MMNRELQFRLDDLEEQIKRNEYRILELEHATLLMVEEKIDEATLNLVSLEEVGQFYDLN